MRTYIIIAAIILLFLFIYNIRNIRMIYIRKLILPFLAILFILSLIIFSRTAVKSASGGINLWLNVVFPSLFPFFVASQILHKTGLVKALGILLEPIMRPLFNVPGCGSFAFAMGITSGYPVGAKITAGMREEKLLTKTEAERLLTFTNNSGPLFIIGAVSLGMFDMPEIGLFLLCSHIAASITVGILFRFYKGNEYKKAFKSKENIIFRFKKELLSGQKNTSQNLGSILGDAIKDSLMTMLSVGGFIIIFSVIISLLMELNLIGTLAHHTANLLAPLNVNEDIIRSLISGLFEITTGSDMSSSAHDAAFIERITAASMIIGWAGLSVHSQVLSIISHTDISLKPYLLGKFLQSILSGLYTFIGARFIFKSVLGAKPVFSYSIEAISQNWYDIFLISCMSLIATLSFLAFIAVLSLIIKKYKKSL